MNYGLNVSSVLYTPEAFWNTSSKMINYSSGRYITCWVSQMGEKWAWQKMHKWTHHVLGLKFTLLTPSPDMHICISDHLDSGCSPCYLSFGRGSYQSFHVELSAWVWVINSLRSENDMLLGEIFWQRKEDSRTYFATGTEMVWRKSHWLK